jgi:hypothetical protein
MLEKKSKIKIKDMDYDFIKIDTIPDGNCYFHSILRSYCKNYINSSLLERIECVNKFRNYLADYLISKNDKNNIIYDTLSNSNLKFFSKDIQQYSLENMLSELKSNNPVDNLYQELISNVFNIDIYIVDLYKQDLYKTASDLNLLYKNRKFIILGFSYENNDSVGHYDSIGINKDGKIYTLFSENHQISKILKKKLI